MATEDITAALQALSILADTATSFKKMEFASDEAERAFNRQQEASEVQFKRQSEFQKDTMMLQNSLQLERDSYNRYKTLMDQVAEYGITYNELESPNAQQILKDMSSNEVREIGEVKSNFERLQQFNMNLSNKIAGHKKVDIERARGLQDKMSLKADQELEAGKMTSKIDSVKLAGLLQDNEQKKITFLTQMRALSSPLTGVSYETDEAELESYKSPYARDALRVSNDYSSKTSLELSSIAQSQMIDYVDQASGEMDFSDEEALKMYVKAEAKEYALDNILNESFGLNENDIDSEGTDSPTSAYKVFEKRYVDAAMNGVKANPNYVFKSQKDIDDSNLNRVAKVKTAYPELYTSLQNAHTEMINMFGVIQENNVFAMTMSKDRKKSTARDLNVSVDQLESLVAQLARSANDPVRARSLMQDNPAIKTILNNSPAGQNYMQYLNDLLLKLDRLTGESKPTYIQNKSDEVARRLIDG